MIDKSKEIFFRIYYVIHIRISLLIFNKNTDK